MIGGIGDTSRRLDYNVCIYTTDEIGDGNPIETVIEQVVKSRADGVIPVSYTHLDVYKRQLVHVDVEILLVKVVDVKTHLNLTVAAI